MFHGQKNLGAFRTRVWSAPQIQTGSLTHNAATFTAHIRRPITHACVFHEHGPKDAPRSTGVTRAWQMSEAISTFPYHPHVRKPHLSAHFLWAVLITHTFAGMRAHKRHSTREMQFPMVCRVLSSRSRFSRP